jgi:hypothetical protein
MRFLLLHSARYCATVRGMDLGIKYQGIRPTARDVAFIKELIAKNPHESRCALSRRLCRAWNWVQPNGALRDMVCRGFLLALERHGHITLPPRRCTPHNPLANRTTPAPVEIDKTPVSARVSDLQPLEIRQVRRTDNEKLFNSLIAHHHYLGYTHPVGEHLKYIVFTKGRPIACCAWASAVRHIGCRDRFIGWSQQMRKQNLHLIAYNTRFLIFDWIKVPHLASHILGKMAKMICLDWQRLYQHPIYFLETFVDTERFAGTCYRAANWQYLGTTTGRGKNDQTHKANRSLKAVWGYPLTKRFRELLTRTHQ